MPTLRIRFSRNALALLLVTVFLNAQNGASLSVSKQPLSKGDAPRRPALKPVFCNVIVTAYHYKINIDPVVLLNITNTDSVDSEENATVQFPAEAFALAKIKLRVVEREACSEKTSAGSAITIKPRGCAIAGDVMEITHLGSGQQLRVSDRSVFAKNNNGEKCSSEKCQILLNEKLDVGDELEFSSLYEIQLTRDYNEMKWEGFYYYNPKHFGDQYDKTSSYPLHTQYIFPTFDKDPIQRATFEMSVSRRKIETEGCISISNSDLLESVDAPGIRTWTIDKFKTTPSLPLDQITVMLLGGFQNHTVYDNSSSNADVNSTQINVWTYQGKNSETSGYEERIILVEGTSRIANEALKLFQFYNGVFNQTAYPLGKIDFVAVPWTTYSLCWTTNFGIIASNEELLLQLENSREITTPNSEIAYQWIGARAMTPPDLTDERFDGKEAFVQFNGLLEYVANWSKDKTNFVSKSSYCSNFDRNNELLEFLESVLTRQVMQSAVADIFLPKFEMTSALPVDFHDAIQQSVEMYNMTHLLPHAPDGKTISIREIIGSWQINGGFKPQIQVDSATVGEGNSSSVVVVLSQEDPFENISPQEFWWVPVKILTENGTHLVWISPNTTKALNKTTELNNAAADKWLIVNSDGKGYYSVKYEKVPLDNIVKQLNEDHTVFSEEIRKALLTSQFDYPIKMENEWEKIRGELELSTYLKSERSVQVWTAVIDRITELRNIIRNYVDDDRNLFVKYYSIMINSVLEDVGLEQSFSKVEANGTDELNQTHVSRENDFVLSAKLMKSCAEFEVESCKKLGSELIAEWRKNPEINPISNGNYSIYVQNQLYCSSIQSENGNEEEHQIFDFLLEQLVKTTDWSQSRVEIGKALTCTNKVHLLTTLLDDTRLANSSKEMQYIYSDEIPYEILMNWPRKMTLEVYRFWTRNVLAGKIVPASLVRYLWTLIPHSYIPPGFVDEISKFFEDHKDLFSNPDDDLSENVEMFKVSIKQSSLNPHRFSNNTGTKMIKWLEEKLPSV